MQHDFFTNFEESDTEEEDEENENLSQDSSWVDINGSGSEISGISFATNSVNGSEVSNHNKVQSNNEDISKLQHFWTNFRQKCHEPLEASIRRCESIKNVDSTW